MQKLKWWLLIVLILAVTGVARFQALNSFSAAVNTNIVAERTGKLLSANNHMLTGKILDTDRDNRLIGFRFKDSFCPNDISVVTFSIGIVAKSFVSDFASEDEKYHFYFYDHHYANSARPMLIAIWAKNLVLTGLNLSSHIRSKTQLAVIWPKECREPKLNWSQIWKSTSNTVEKIKS